VNRNSTGGGRVGKGTLYHMAARGIFLVSDFAIHVYVARALGPEVYGIWGVILALLAIAAQPLNSGLSLSVSKYVAEDNRRSSALLVKGIAGQMVLAAILMSGLIGFSGPISSLLDAPVLGNYLIQMSIILPCLGAVAIWLGLFNGLRSFGRETIVMSAYPLVRSLAAILFISLGYGLEGIIWGFIVGIGFSVLIAWLLYRAPEERVEFAGSRLTRFAVPVFIMGMVMIAIPNIDLLFVKGMVLDEKDVGVYNSARTLAKSFYFFFLAIQSTIFPSLVESISSNDRERTSTYIRQGIRYLMIMALPVTCLIAAPGPDLLVLIFSRVYSGGGGSLTILMFGFTLLTLFSVLTTILMAGKRSGWAVAACSILMPVDIVLNLILIPRYQILGAAMATSLTGLFGVAVASAMVMKEHQTLCGARSLLNIGLASGAVYLLLELAGPTGFMIIPWGFFSMIAYTLSLLVLGELKADDWMVIRRVLRLSPAFPGAEAGGGRGHGR